MPEGSPQEALLLRKLNCGKISEAEFAHLVAMTKHQTALDSLDARRGAAQGRRGAAITKSASNPQPASRSTPGSTSASALPKWGVHRAAQSSVRTAVQPGQAPEAPPTAGATEATGQTSSQRLGSFFRGLAPKVVALRDSVRESGASRVARWRGADAHGGSAVSGDGDGAAEQGDLDSAEQYGVEMGSAWPTIRTPHNHDPSPACTTVDNGAAAGAADLGGTASADPELAAKLKVLEDKYVTATDASIVSAPMHFHAQCYSLSTCTLFPRLACSNVDALLLTGSRHLDASLEPGVAMPLSESGHCQRSNARCNRVLTHTRVMHASFVLGTVAGCSRAMSAICLST